MNDTHKILNNLDNQTNQTDKIMLNKLELENETVNYTQLLDNLMNHGAHYGHMSYQRHPKANKYICASKDNEDIINLDLTCKMMEESFVVIEQIIARGGKILFVSTKPQMSDIIKEFAEKFRQYYMVKRWFPGTLTNFKTIVTTLLNNHTVLQKIEIRQSKNMITKKEASSMNKKIQKSNSCLVGITDMQELPQCIFVIDINHEKIAVREANIMGIPVVALIDTNCNPDNINYPIPCNDDSVSALSLILGCLRVYLLSGIKKYMKKYGSNNSYHENKDKKPYSKYDEQKKTYQQKYGDSRFKKVNITSNKTHTETNQDIKGSSK